jgi:SAM-dependent methyltransferase
MTNCSQEQNLIKEVSDSINNDTFIRIIISNTIDKSSDLQKVSARLLEIRNESRLSFNYRYRTKDIEKNYSVKEGINEVQNLLTTHFHDATLFTTKKDIYLTGKGKKKKITTVPPSLTTKISKEHNRKKQRMIKTENNIYLQDLGITDNRHKVKKNMQDKYRQIEKFIEIADSLIKESGLSSPIKVADMGCGKGYLTFALYDHIRNTIGTDVEMEGVERRKDLVEICNQIAKKACFDKLNFKQGSINAFEIDSVDMLIALHACDTATDDAIIKGIKSGAKVIICAPCCHKQVRKDMDIAKELVPILKHGILAEREAEILTDGIRALILELHRYKTKVFEFISSHHTAKNLMITAVKSGRKPDKEKIMDEIAHIKKFFGVKSHYLEENLS